MNYQPALLEVIRTIQLWTLVGWSCLRTVGRVRKGTGRSVPSFRGTVPCCPAPMMV